ncbi:MAG: helix-turn-helix transcriptional regulator [Saprospiraceae bacterium]|nr:helix-turn-helix transcriptional regulator [Saprospiraceae bacterium]
MGKIIYWTLENASPALQPIETNSLFYAENVVRYLKFTSAAAVRFCLSNSVTYILGNQFVKINSGSYFTVNNGTELECLPTPPGTKAVMAFFTTQLLADVNRTLSGNDKLLLNAPEAGAGSLHFFEHLHRQPSRLSTQLQRIAHQMAASGKDNPTCSHDLFFSLAENLLMDQRQTRQQINSINARSFSTKEELYRRVLAAHSFMHDQWDAPLTLHEVARYACLSPYHFHRTFREIFGESPMLWFRKLKLEKAKALLAQYNITEAALRCGYGDLVSFSKAFKRHWGVCPSDWTGMAKR